MTLVEVLILLAVAAVCGAIGQIIAGFSRGGFIVAIILGFIGAMIGMWMARNLHLPEPLMIQVGTITFPVLWSIIGSAVFIAIIGLMTRRTYYT